MATESNKEKIVDAALQMFNERGCRGVTMDNIAQAVHISKRTLYETFSNKEELLDECLKHIHEHTNNMHRLAHSRVDEPILVAMYMLHTNALYAKKYCRLMEETERYYPDIHDRYFRVHSDELRAIMQKGLAYADERGFLRPDINKDYATDFLCELIQRHRLSDIENREDYISRLNEICFTYLRGMMTTDTIQRYENEESHMRDVIKEITESENKKI